MSLPPIQVAPGPQGRVLFHDHRHGIQYALIARQARRLAESILAILDDPQPDAQSSLPGDNINDPF